MNKREQIARWLYNRDVDMADGAEISWLEERQGYIISAAQIITLLSEGAEPPMLPDKEILQANSRYEWNTEDDYQVVDEESNLGRWRAITKAAIENCTPYWQARIEQAVGEADDAYQLMTKKCGYIKPSTANREAVAKKISILCYQHSHPSVREIDNYNLIKFGWYGLAYQILSISPPMTANREVVAKAPLIGLDGISRYFTNDKSNIFEEGLKTGIQKQRDADHKYYLPLISPPMEVLSEEEIRKEEGERIVKDIEETILRRPDYSIKDIIVYLKYRLGINQATIKEE